MRSPIALLASCAVLLVPAVAAAQDERESLYPAAVAMPDRATVELFTAPAGPLAVWLAVDGTGQPWWASGQGPAISAAPTDGPALAPLAGEAPLTAFAAGGAGAVYGAAQEPARVFRAAAGAPAWTVDAGDGGGRVTDLAVGDDGAVWYSAIGPDRIGRIDADGTGAQEWPTAGELRRPLAIAVDATGRPWVGGRNAVAQLAPATGTLTRERIGSVETVVDLAIAPDGTLWAALEKGTYSSGNLVRVADGESTAYFLEGRMDPLALGFAGDDLWVSVTDRDSGLVRVRGTGATWFPGPAPLAFATTGDRVLTIQRSSAGGGQRRYELATLLTADVADVGAFPAEQTVDVRLPRWARKPFSFAEHGFEVPVFVTLARPGDVTLEVAFDVPPGERFLAQKFPRTRTVEDPSQPERMVAFLNYQHTQRLREMLTRYPQLTAHVKVIGRSDDQRVVKRLRLVVRR